MDDCRHPLLLLASIACAAMAPPASGQAAAVAARALLERQQQHDEFVLRLRQFEERAKPALTAAERQRLLVRQHDERLDQTRLHVDQLRRHGVLEQTLPLLPETAQTLAIEHEKADFARESALP